MGFTTKATRSYHKHTFAPNDVLLFGPETRGLPQTVLEQLPDHQRLRIPMRAQSRSLNLANAVGVVLYEGWRQLGFSSGQ